MPLFLANFTVIECLRFWSVFLYEQEALSHELAEKQRIWKWYEDYISLSPLVLLCPADIVTYCREIYSLLLGAIHSGQLWCQTNHCVVLCGISSELLHGIGDLVLLEHVNFLFLQKFKSSTNNFDLYMIKGSWARGSRYSASQVKLLILSQLSCQKFGNSSLVSLTAVHNGMAHMLKTFAKEQKYSNPQTAMKTTLHPYNSSCRWYRGDLLSII